MNMTLVWLFRIITAAAVLFFLYSVFSRIQILKKAGHVDRFNKIKERILGILLRMFGQRRLFYDPVPGLAHAFIFWGFCVVSIESLHFFLSAFGIQYRLILGRGFYYTAFEVFGILVIMGILFGLGRRLFFKVKRLKHSVEGIIILLLIFGLMATGLIINAAETVIHNDANCFKAVSNLFVPLFSSLSGNANNLIFNISWWTHGLVFLLFLNLLPYSKHMHILTIFFNVFFRNLDPPGKFTKPDLENSEEFGLAGFKHLTWKDVLDGFTCTECGRCTERCPANSAGKHLDPREIILSIRDYVYANHKKADNDRPPLIDHAIPKKDIWDCTTCHGCVSACPVENEHIAKIIEMRRNRVLMEGDMPEAYQTTFKNLENNANPWGIASSQRGDWAGELQLPLLKDKPDAEYLFFLGCAGAYDTRAKKVIQSFANIMKKADVSFAVLGEEEFCCGDPARRMGNEYLFQEMVNANKEIVDRYKVRKVITIDPHCFSTLKNEYPDFGMDFEVLHHTAFIHQLISQDKLALNGNSARHMTFHDSCYLGRYNNIFEPPRAVLGKLGHRISEMENSRRNSYCCGAGGGMMWLEEEKEHRLNEKRVKEALATRAEAVVTACPFCLTMFEDGLKEMDKETPVYDIAEVVEMGLK